MNCQSSPVSGNYNYIVLNEENLGSGYKPKNPTEENIANSKIKLDTMCLDSQSKMPEEIVFSDGVVFYSAGTTAFGTQYMQSWNEKGEILTNEHIGRFFSPPDIFPANYGDENGFDMVYRVVCLDVDGFDKEENPFGYGIRADGKILTGKRADEWIKKSIQKEN